MKYICRDCGHESLNEKEFYTLISNDINPKDKSLWVK